MKTLTDIPELKGKKVIVRIDFNVPMENGAVQDDTRIQAAIPTINFLRENGAKIILISHLGRPKGEVREELRLTKVAAHLSKLLDHPVKKLDTITGPESTSAITEMQDGEIIMLENIRFNPLEKTCDLEFSKELANLADIYVNDAFGTAHRKHASTYGIAQHIPAYAGKLIQAEVEALSPLIHQEPQHPLCMIFGGAKIDTKIGVIQNFIGKADYFLIGGGIANTFLHALGHNVGDSLYEADKKDLALKILEKAGDSIILPTDVIVATEISHEAEAKVVKLEEITPEMKILDIGPESAAHYAEIIQKSQTVIWNGPVGLYEFSQFSQGSLKIAKAIAEHTCHSIIGGGDSVDAIKRFQIPTENFSHISTGGGACIEFLEGKELPGISCLS